MTSDPSGKESRLGTCSDAPGRQLGGSSPGRLGGGTPHCFLRAASPCTCPAGSTLAPHPTTAGGLGSWPTLLASPRHLMLRYPLRDTPFEARSTPLLLPPPSPDHSTIPSPFSLVPLPYPVQASCLEACGHILGDLEQHRSVTNQFWRPEGGQSPQLKACWWTPAQPLP